MYRAEQLFNPRSFVYSSNREAVVLQSVTPETRITFLNSASAESNYDPRYSLCYSNEEFHLLANDVPVATFRESPWVSGERETILPGSIYTSNVSIMGDATKAFVLQDYNVHSKNLFAGAGFQDNAMFLQLPNRMFHYAFQSAAAEGLNTEWMRIQESSTGRPQVGIGTVALASNMALTVSGNASIDGSLKIAGALEFDSTGFIKKDPETSRLATTDLPEKVPVLNADNKLDESMLPQSFNFQFMRSQKNVGIGTRAPAQKLHVWGSAAVSERIGVGTTTPTSRLHIFEGGAAIAALKIESRGGGDVMQASIGNESTPSFLVVGTHPGVGIGTASVQPQNALEVGGNAHVHGKLTCAGGMDLSGKMGSQGIEVTSDTGGLIFKSEVLFSQGVPAQAVTGAVPFLFYGGIATPEIRSTTNTITFENEVLFRYGHADLSDMRKKFNITRIPEATLKLDFLRGYTYHLGDNNFMGGVLAQEVVQAMPEAVIKKDGYYAVRYNSIIALLIEGFHELKKRIRLLELRG